MEAISADMAMVSAFQTDAAAAMLSNETCDAF